jgi:hypothetical protein
MVVVVALDMIVFVLPGLKVVAVTSAHCACTCIADDPVVVNVTISLVLVSNILPPYQENT